jgi:hypothetical protein
MEALLSDRPIHIPSPPIISPENLLNPLSQTVKAFTSFFKTEDA